MDTLSRLLSLYTIRTSLDIRCELAARRGTPGGDAKLDALSTFVRAVVGSRGTVAQPVVDAVKAAGYTDEQIVDTIFAITSITFTNLVNRVTDTALDFPKAPA